MNFKPFHARPSADYLKLCANQKNAVRIFILY
jgi:hypothetical protein